MKTISFKSARIIPIRDRAIWNEIIVPRYKVQLAAFEARKHTSDKYDYPLFEDLEWNRANKTLRQAYLNLKLEPKTYHSCRHSFTTHLVGETRNFFLVRAITGHKKDKSFYRYLHIFEQIAVEAAQAAQDIDVV
jgi:integrase